MPESPPACGKLVEVFSGFQFSFGKDHPVGWTEIALADFNYMSSNQLSNSLQINIVFKLGPLEIGNY